MEIEHELAITSVKGVYKQVKLYERDGYIYAGQAGGFVRLSENGSTSCQTVRLDTMTWTGDLFADKLGRLCRPEVNGARAVNKAHATLLLGLDAPTGATTTQLEVSKLQQGES